MTCDHNPIHCNRNNTVNIAHGMLYGSMFSAMIGNYVSMKITYNRIASRNDLSQTNIRVYPIRTIRERNNGYFEFINQLSPSNDHSKTNIQIKTNCYFRYNNFKSRKQPSGV